MKKEIDGFILKGHAYDQNGKLHLKFFGQSSLGPFQLLINDFRGYFFVETNLESEIKSITNKKVLKVYYSSFEEKKSLKARFENQSLQTFEYDIRPIDQFLMDKKIFAEVIISGEYKTENDKLFFLNPTLNPGKFYPDFSIFSFDIETAKDGRVLSIAYTYRFKKNETRQVLMLGQVAAIHENIQVSFWDNEIQLINQFASELKKLDPDILIGWNVIGFDLKYLIDRSTLLKNKFELSRDNRSMYLYQNPRGDYSIDIPGRVVIDGPWALKMNFFSYESFKLNSVAKNVLGESKDIDEDEFFDKWSEIERRYKEDKTALARYNLKDSDLVLAIFDKTSILDLLINRSIISGMLLEKVGGSTAAFDHFYLPKLHQYNLTAPDVENIGWDQEAKGGFVLSPKIGIHDNVLVLDFKSLYPTVIRTFLIDPLSLFLNDDNPISTPVGVKFSCKHYILPNKISELLDKRSQAKKDKNQNLSMAIKILMNSFYGVLGSSGCRFYHSILPQAITGTGQWVLKTTISFLEQSGFEILYGDTDSIFVGLNYDCDIFEEGRRIVEDVNTFLKQRIKNEFGLDSFLEIQFDKFFKKLILTSTRSQLDGAKKRYAGLLNKVQDGKYVDEIVMTGMEYVRSDWSEIARKFQYELVNRIFNNLEIKEFILQTIRDLEAGKYDHQLILRKRLTKPFEEYIKNIPPHVKASRLLFEKLGIRKNRSEFIMTKRGAIPIELPHDDIDYEYYIEKQLLPVADSLLVLIGESFDSIRNNQLSLF